MKRRNFAKTVGLAAIGIQAYAVAGSSNFLELNSLKSIRVPLGLCDHSLRSSKLNTLQLIEYAIQNQLDSVMLNTLKPFQSLEENHLLQLKQLAYNHNISLYIGAGSISENAKAYKDTYGSPKELLIEGIRVAKILGSPTVACRIGDIKDRYHKDGTAGSRRARMKNTWSGPVRMWSAPRSMLARKFCHWLESPRSISPDGELAVWMRSSLVSLLEHAPPPVVGDEGDVVAVGDLGEEWGERRLQHLGHLGDVEVHRERQDDVTEAVGVGALLGQQLDPVELDRPDDPLGANLGVVVGVGLEACRGCPRTRPAVRRRCRRSRGPAQSARPGTASRPDRSVRRHRCRGTGTTRRCGGRWRVMPAR